MSGESAILYPKWLDKLPAKKRNLAKQKFLLRLAALHYSPEGTVQKLSTGLGLHERTLTVLEFRKTMLTPRLCVAVEKLVGREIVPREALNPELFDIPA